jgi:hypothetical protein
VRANPGGLGETLRAGVRRRLTSSDAPLLREASAYLGTTLMATPTFARAGVQAELQPLSVLKLTAGADACRWFGTLEHVLSFPSMNVDASPERLAALDAGGASRATSGASAWGAVTLQAAAGPWMARSTTTATFYDLALPPGDSAFFDGWSDRLLADGGGFLGQDDDVLVDLGPARVGARYSWTADLSGAEGAATESQQRVGPIVVVPLSGVRYGAAPAHAAFVLAQAHLRHPYRSGVLVAAGVTLAKDVALRR